MLKHLQKIAIALVVCLSSTSWANTIEEKPSAAAMIGDTVIARPLLATTTVIGLATFIVSSPFSAIGNNFGESWDVLVAGPAEATFVRCLGCTISGKKSTTIVEQEDN